MTHGQSPIRACQSCGQTWTEDHPYCPRCGSHKIIETRTYWAHGMDYPQARIMIPPPIIGVW